MTVTCPLPGSDLPATTPSFDIEHILASIETMAAQRPVAAQIVSVANARTPTPRRWPSSSPATWPWPARS